MAANTDNNEDQPRGFKAWFQHAFAVDKYDESCLTDDDKDVLQRIAERIHAKQMIAATILWAESHRNLNFIGSQAMLVVQPAFEMTHTFINFALGKLGIYIPPDDYPKLQAALEKRYSIEYFIQLLEAKAATDYNTGLTKPTADADGTAADSSAEDPPDRADH